MSMEETNGGRHSRLGVRFDLIPPIAIHRLAEILHDGAIAHSDADGSNWRKLPTNVHLNHALCHIYSYLGGDTLEDHLGHALTRLAMAIETREAQGLSHHAEIKKMGNAEIQKEWDRVSHPTDQDGYHL